MDIILVFSDICMDLKNNWLTKKVIVIKSELMFPRWQDSHGLSLGGCTDTHTHTSTDTGKECMHELPEEEHTVRWAALTSLILQCAGVSCALLLLLCQSRSVREGGTGGPPGSPQLWVDGISDLRTFRLRVHLLSSLDFPPQSPQQVWPLWSPAAVSHPDSDVIH